MLALPRADHLQVHLVLGFLDDRERLDEGLAQELHQGLAAAQRAQCLIQGARQTEGQIVRAAELMSVSVPFAGELREFIESLL